jgi:hypothetical protein
MYTYINFVHASTSIRVLAWQPERAQVHHRLPICQYNCICSGFDTQSVPLDPAALRWRRLRRK